jgi:hypothetical protein
MNRVIKLFKRIVKEEKKVLGRWKVSTSNREIDYKMLRLSQDYTYTTQKEEEDKNDIDTQIMLRYMV